MREWLMKLRSAHGIQWAAAAILTGLVALIVSNMGSNAATDYERRLQRILASIDGAGEVRVMVHEYDTDLGPRIGVVVLAEGAGDVRVALEIARAVRALTGAQAADVEVMSMGAGP